MRLPWQAAVGGVALALLGAAGLVRGAVPLATPAAHTGTNNLAEPIVVSNGYIRPPAPPSKSAAAYFTVFNTTKHPDRLIAVDSGAGATSVIHTPNMTKAKNGVLIPAHGKVVLSTGHGHVMIQQLFGKLKPGQTVNLNLTFEHAGIVTITAKVIALGTPAPTGG